VFVKLSPTKIGTWQDCPRRFYYSYVARERSRRSWAHFSYGNAVHGALRAWFDVPSDARKVDPEAELVDQLVDRSWSNAGFRDADQAAEWKQRAVRIVRDYLSGLDPHFEPLSTERNLAFKQDGFIVEGRIGRLDESARVVTVVEYKTGKSAPSSDEVRGSAALAMYALMVQRALDRPCFDVALHHVPSGARVAWQHSAQSLDRHLNRIAGIAADIGRVQDTWESTDQSEEIRDELFPPQPGALCAFCDYWSKCPAGQLRSPQRESWEGLSRDDA